VEQLIATVKKDRSEMVRVKSRVTGLVSAVHHFARRGACLSLKATGRGNIARRLVHAFNLWKRTESSSNDTSGSSSPIRSPIRATAALGRSDLEGSLGNDQISLASSSMQPPVPAVSANALAAAQASAEAFEDQDRDAAAMVQRKAADAAAALAVAEAAAAEASAAQALTEALKACPWQPVEEEGTGDTYWWNRATNDVTWDTPQEVLAIQDEASLSRSRERGSAESGNTGEDYNDGSNNRYDTAEASNAEAAKDEEDDDDDEDAKHRQRNAALAAAASAASDAANAQAAYEAMAAREANAQSDAAADMSTRQERTMLVAAASPDEAPAVEETKERSEADPAAVAAAAAATKAELMAAAEAAKQLALSTLAASKQAAVDASAASARAAERAVPALATRVVARHADELRRIVLDCANRASPAACARGLGAWAVARSKILDETEDAEADGASSPGNAASTGASAGKEDAADREAAAERFRLACTLVVEVLDGELASLREEALVTAALPLTQSKQSKPSLRIGGAKFNAAAGLAAQAQASVAHAANAAASAGTPGKSQTSVEDPLAAYVSRLVAPYCKPAANASEEGGGKKKRAKRGGGAHPRPVNHPVLSSSLVLKSAPDFHPPQAQVLGELGASGRLADGVLTHLLDELIEELQTGKNDVHQSNGSIPANSTAAISDSSSSSSGSAAGSSGQSGLIGQWRQSILEASAVSHSTGESYDFAHTEELNQRGVSADNESDDPPTPAAYLDLAL